jgi:hypothetical protein
MYQKCKKLKPSGKAYSLVLSAYVLRDIQKILLLNFQKSVEPEASKMTSVQFKISGE